MALAPQPRYQAPAESPGDLSRGGAKTHLPLALDILREAITRFPACRTLAELFSVFNQCSSTLLPTAQSGFLLRQPDACFELAYYSPNTTGTSIRDLTEHLIESGHFAQALKQGIYRHRDATGQTSLMVRIATPQRIYGIALWSGTCIPTQLHQALGALTDLIALSFDHFQGGADAFLVTTHDERPAPADGAYPHLDIAIPADQLTGLPHRTHFLRFLRTAVEERTAQTCVGTILLDIDGFNRVNSELGCDTGDQVLRDVAQRLDNALRSRFVYETLGVADRDLCFARTGADEFGLAIARLPNPAQLPEVANHLHQHVAEGFLQHNSRLYLSVSMGLAVSESMTAFASPQTLMRDADTALKKAKSSGRNKHVLYTPHRAETGSSHLRIESLLQEALRQNRFVLHYQPLFELTDTRLIGAEVLLRLNMDDGTPIPPSQFIPVAESTGQIVEIGEWVTRQLCRQIHRWDAQALPAIPFAVNVSAIEFSQPGLTERIVEILAQEGVTPARIKIEITETAIARNEAQALANIRALRAAGFEVWIDDFGTGYSSLKSIKNFPISGFKLDREFVKDLVGDPAAEVIAASILTMASQLGYPVVAEGIETAAQLAFLRGEGCACGQGFYLGRPVAADDFESNHLLSAVAPE